MFNTVHSFYIFWTHDDPLKKKKICTVLAVTDTFALFFLFFFKLFPNDEFYVTLAMSPEVLVYGTAYVVFVGWVW